MRKHRFREVTNKCNFVDQSGNGWFKPGKITDSPPPTSSYILTLFFGREGGGRTALVFGVWKREREIKIDT